MKAKRYNRRLTAVLTAVALILIGLLYYSIATDLKAERDRAAYLAAEITATEYRDLNRLVERTVRDADRFNLKSNKLRVEVYFATADGYVDHTEAETIRQAARDLNDIVSYLERRQYKNKQVEQLRRSASALVDTK